MSGTKIAQLPGLATMMQAPTTPWRTDTPEEEEYAADPKAFLLARCQWFMDNVEWFHNYVVTATYYLPAFQVLSSGHKIVMPQVIHDETQWQGKVGLVIGKGPLAFKDDERVQFHGQDVNIGDWVQYDIHDGRQFTINRVHCRLLKDVYIIARLKDPRLVY